MRLRAAVFVNLVDMRDAMSMHRGNRFCTLSPQNLAKLQQANYLFHSAVNGSYAQCWAYVSHRTLELLDVPCTLTNPRLGLRSHRERLHAVESAAEAAQVPRLHSS